MLQGFVQPLDAVCRGAGFPDAGCRFPGIAADKAKGLCDGKKGIGNAALGIDLVKGLDELAVAISGLDSGGTQIGKLFLELVNRHATRFQKGHHALEGIKVFCRHKATARFDTNIRKRRPETFLLLDDRINGA